MDKVTLHRAPERPPTNAVWIRPHAHADEHDADASAAHVLAGARLGPRPGAPGADRSGAVLAPALAADVAREQGVSLDEATSVAIGDRMGFDLATVRVHTGARAARAAALVDARAYTVGRDIVFGDHEYAPRTAVGMRVLLHELAHVARHGCPTHQAYLLHRLAKGPKPPKGSMLEKALDAKDDDPVRDLVASKEWKTTVLDPDHAAWLIIYLLVGFTGDDDEQAGLRIIENVSASKRLDLTLTGLKEEDRWEQLFDDYHGADYVQLLDALAKGIQTLDFRAAYLDKFIDEWHVDETEEGAIARLLLLTPDDELSPILDKKNREAELRTAIDNKDPRKAFEYRIVRKNEISFLAGAKSTETALGEHAKTSPEAKQRTPAEIKALLDDAPKDLAAELKAYKDRIMLEIGKPEPDWKAVSTLHMVFLAGLATLEARKKTELDMEFRYNRKFNIYKRDPTEKDPERWPMIWTEADLKELDQVLKKLPPGVLSTGTALETFARAAEASSVAGTGTSKEVTLFGRSGLGLRVVAHELGHTVSFTDNSKMQNAFEKKFKWEKVAAKDVPADAKKKLDKLKEDDLSKRGSREKDGDWFYRRDRYSDGSYLRHPKDLCFISDYASSDRYDDFADSFEEYVVDPKKLQKECKDKYDFMHVEVFVKYFLEKQGEKVLKDWDDAVAKGRDSVTFAILLDTKVLPTYVTPMRTDLATALTADVAMKHTAAEAGLIKAPQPLKGTEAEKIAAPFRTKLASLFDLLAPIVPAEKDFKAAFDAHPHKPKKSQEDALEYLGYRLKWRLVRELVEMWKPLAERVMKGEKVDIAEMAGVKERIAKYHAGIPRVKGALRDYLPVYKLKDELADELVPGPKKVAFADKKEDEIMDRILEPKPKKGGKVQRQEAGGTSVAERRPEPSQLVPGGGRPMRPDTRAFMEAQMGRDFGDVRVHDDAEAAGAADALQADAYTVGRDIMFAEGRNAPDTAEGRELLGHELAHVAQQGEAGAAPPAEAPGGPQASAERLPTILEEPVAIPDMFPPDKAEEKTIAPIPPASGEQEAPAQATPVIALRRVPGATISGADIVPADHPSEREAAAVGRRVAGRENGGHDLRTGANAAPVHRQPAAGAGQQAQRVDVVFFMGHRDKPGNPFYSNARGYFKAHVKSDLTVDNDNYRSLAGVFTYLRGLDPSKPLGHVYLVSHANEDGTLSFPLEKSDTDRKTSYGELKDAIVKRPDLFAMPFGLIDRQTIVHIKGCNIGRSTEMLNKLDEAFGGRALVTAPTHKQAYGTWTEGGKTERFEALSTYFLEYTGPVTKTRPEQLAEFKGKYPHIPEKRWTALLPKKGAKREVVAFRFSYSNAADEAEAMSKAMAYGDDNFTRPEVYVWRVASKKRAKTAGRFNFELVAEKTNYTIARTIEDEEKKRLTPDEADPLYFGKSTLAAEPTAAALRLEPAKMTTPALLARMSEIDTELATPRLLEDPGSRQEAAFEKRTMEEELGRRNVAVDVNVVKTEDWLGADEVYVKASRGSAVLQTKTHKLNDGQQRVYTVPLLSFLPLGAPIRFEVYDEDWPDRDDLIVRMDWAAPYAPQNNSESFDKADYRVQVRFEK